MSVVAIRQFLKLRIYVAYPTGDTDGSGDIERTDPKKVWAQWADSVQKSRYHQSTETEDRSELITLEEIPQRAHVWGPGRNPHEDDPVEPDFTDRVFDPHTGKTIYYVTRI